MKILAVECSAGPASAAIIEDGKILSNAFVNVKITHSQTLMPMVDCVLKASGISIDDIDGFAVGAGPGSFTGIRIGISAVKGMAAVKNIPCAPISTIRAMAENYKEEDCIVCGVMDARCNQVYNAFFDITNGKIRRICKDRAIMCDELAEEIKKISKNVKKSVIIVGDGSDLFYPYVENIECTVKSDFHRRYQNAIGIALASEEIFKSGNSVSQKDLLPVYLRLPQAERELKKKTEGVTK